MRLDLFLKVSRLLPRRSLAQEFCEKNLVKVNGSTAKSSRTVSVGDEIEIKRRDRTTVIRVLAVPSSKQVSKEAAAGLYDVSSETANENGVV